MGSFYDTPEWRALSAAAIARDGYRCTVSRLLGGPCAGLLHAHHIVPLREGGSNDLDNLGTACAAHHPKWEALRRGIVRSRRRERPRCPHKHRHAEARRLCEERLAAARA